MGPAMSARIAIAGFQHETNSFTPFATSYADFLKADGWPGLTRGPAIAEVFAALNIPIGGFLTAARDWDLVPLIWASAEPGGPVSDEAFENIAAMICDGLAAAGPLDGVYLDLHGAMVTESLEDGEGALLARVRQVVGPDLPLVVSLDFHANLTAEIVAAASALAIFRSYPHLDMAETGARAQALLADLLAHGGPYHRAWAQLPYLVPLSSQATTRAPLQAVYADLARPAAAGLANLELAMGFPAADIRDSGPAVVAYGRDAGAVETAAADLLAEMQALEARFEDPLLDPAAAVRRAREIVAAGGGPVVLADVQDNPGAGGSGDTAGLLAALAEGGAQGAALALLWDPEAARRAHETGIGGRFETSLGGRYPETGDRPFACEVAVEALSDGRFTCTGAMYGGIRTELGPTALLRIARPDAEVRVLVSDSRYQCLDLEVFRHLGIEPTETPILAVKSTVHFLADFAPIAGEVLFAAAPGAHLCRLTEVPYRRLRPGVRLGPGGPEQGGGT